jgi:hypothetical protein
MRRALPLCRYSGTAEVRHLMVRYARMYSTACGPRLGVIAPPVDRAAVPPPAPHGRKLLADPTRCSRCMGRPAWPDRRTSTTRLDWFSWSGSAGSCAARPPVGLGRGALGQRDVWRCRLRLHRGQRLRGSCRIDRLLRLAAPPAATRPRPSRSGSGSRRRALLLGSPRPER